MRELLELQLAHVKGELELTRVKGELHDMDRWTSVIDAHGARAAHLSRLSSTGII